MQYFNSCFVLDAHTYFVFYFLPTLQTVHMDPCLDDCVMFAKRLKALKKKVNMDILKGLPHGFLNLAIVSKSFFYYLIMYISG